MVLYQTAGNSFICHKIEFTQWMNEKNYHTGKVCKTTEEIIDFFGFSRLAKDLYAEAKIDEAIVVE